MGIVRLEKYQFRDYLVEICGETGFIFKIIAGQPQVVEAESPDRRASLVAIGIIGGLSVPGCELALQAADRYLSNR